MQKKTVLNQLSNLISFIHTQSESRGPDVLYFTEGTSSPNSYRLLDEIFHERLSGRRNHGYMLCETMVTCCVFVCSQDKESEMKLLQSTIQDLKQQVQYTSIPDAIGKYPESKNTFGTLYYSLLNSEVSLIEGVLIESFHCSITHLACDATWAIPRAHLKIKGGCFMCSCLVSSLPSFFDCMK